MFTQRYASFVTLLCVLLTIALGFLGSFAFDVRVELREANAALDAHMAQNRAAVGFDRLCAKAGGHMIQYANTYVCVRGDILQSSVIVQTPIREFVQR